MQNVADRISTCVDIVGRDGPDDFTFFIVHTGLRRCARRHGSPHHHQQPRTPRNSDHDAQPTASPTHDGPAPISGLPTRRRRRVLPATPKTRPRKPVHPTPGTPSVTITRGPRPEQPGPMPMAKRWSYHSGKRQNLRPTLQDCGPLSEPHSCQCHTEVLPLGVCAADHPGSGKDNRVERDGRHDYPGPFGGGTAVSGTCGLQAWT